MTAEGLSFASLLHGEFEQLLHPAGSRRRIARQVPRLVAERLARPVEQEERAQWAARFVQELWPALQAERGHKWDLGWDELVAGFAVGIELLTLELPASVCLGIEGTPAQPLWERWRRPYARYALLLDSGIRICRVFVPVSRLTPGEPVEKTVLWRHDGPAFHGRSHTLLLALMAKGMLPETLGPLAATGELDTDGCTVRPVQGLVLKVQAWRRAFPEGLLITGPLGRLGEKDWQALAERRGFGSINAVLTDRWFTGGSMAELAEKLNAPAPVIKRWDGAVLDPTGIAEARLEGDAQESPERILGDALLDAAWAASQHGKAEGGRCGILIEGVPGAGKSTLSRVLDQRFRAGLLGTLGFGVRRSARELAEDLRQAPSRTWSGLLAIREPERRALFEELERTGRLVPIVDGLDELGGVQLREVAELLRGSPGWWMATSRPVASIRTALPPAWRLQVREPSEEEGRKLLTGAGRADLAKRLYGDYSLRSRLPGSLVALTRTPLHLALLAQVVREGEDLEQLADHTLYHRVFGGLLDQALAEQRLTEHGARKLRELHVEVIGELALAWLREPRGYLDGAAVDLILDEAGFKPSERPEFVRSLEFGHLLAPARDSWDFAHRTVAEWAASEALHRKVARRQREHARSSGTADDRVPRARIELEVLESFLDGGSWAQFLRFYAPHLSEPLAFLDRLTDVQRFPERVEHDTPLRERTPVSDALKTWDFIFELLSLAVWRRQEDAHLAWGIAVRRWLLFEHSGERFVEKDQKLSTLREFSRAVEEHLPRTLVALCLIAGRTEAQRARLRAEPEQLLPAIPPSHASVLEPLLRGGSRKTQLDVLEWYALHGLEVDGEIINTLIHDLPAEVAEAGNAAQAEWLQLQHKGPGEHLPKLAQHQMLCRLEAVVWEASLRTRQGLPWSQVRTRLQRWPQHLESVILRWFGMRSEERNASAAEAEHRHRRDVLAACLEEANTLTGKLVSTLKRLRTEPGGPEAVGHLGSWLDDSDDRHIHGLLGEVAAKAGWEPPRGGRGGERAQALEADLRLLYRIRQRPEAIIKALDETRLEPVLGELWRLLPPAQPEREVLLGAIDATSRPPPQVPARLLLELREGFSWGLGQIAWTRKHLDELRQLSAVGPGAIRFAAIRLLAQAEERNETLALLQAVPSADEKLLELIRHHVERQPDWEDRVPTEFLPPEVLAQLPLEQRVARAVPGWRSELIAQLAEPSNELGSLAKLAAQKQVHEALPLLAKRLERRSWQDRQLIEAIVQLCTPADVRWARMALHHALLHCWPDNRAERYRRSLDKEEGAPAGEALAGFLTLEDLDLLVQSGQSALRHPSLAEAIRGLGSEARARLFTHYREAAGEMAALEHGTRDVKEWEPSPEGKKTARARRDALAETLVVSFDPELGRLADLIELAFQVAGGDVHHVYSMTGPLGSDFDQPSDLDWYSDQQNAALVEALGGQLEDRLAREPGAWPELRRLFRHPSETLRLRAFELCAAHAAPHEVAELALEALEGHTRANRTRWTGNTMGYRLSGGSGAGSSHVDSPETWGRLRNAVQQRLTPAHRRVIETLVGHELPMFRALAAQWAGQLGNASWSGLILQLLGDPEAGVVLSGLDALLVLAPERVDGALRQADRSAWTSLHDAVVVQRLRPPKRRHKPINPWAESDEPIPVDPLKHVSAATVELLLNESTERCSPAPEDARPVPTAFDGFPSPFEELCTPLWKDTLPGPECVEMLARWSQHPMASVRAVARRLRAAHGLLTAQELMPLLTGEPLEQISAAECLVRMADESRRAEASAVWLAALGRDEHRGRFAGQYFYWEKLPDRLMWALRGATPAFAPLLGLVAEHIDYDHEEGTDTEAGDRVVKQTLKVIRRWGEKGVAALLDLIEAREVEDHYTFLDVVKTTARSSESFLELLRKRAAVSCGPAQRAYTEMCADIERADLHGLTARLFAEVFPEGWPMIPPVARPG
ncbi:hypothetical protein [Corallococcus exiguus]|uniref:hypothetical protein n=1 Tax=Corallococcus exiguus TaxID=83462 RepID=UPI001471798E|nr:hypothetical protein [Corallococcus exiguus]NNB85293.1 hypothetical protein [Corallococcus exiguus]